MKNGRKVLIGICLLIAAAAMGYIAHYQLSKHDNEQIYKRVEKDALQTPKVPEDALHFEPEPEQIPIDFASLWEKNSEIYAWIEIPGADISYPIAQRWGDDEYYLNHTIEGKAGYPGSIYTESINSQDFSDFNTVIYGHNMKDGSMFHNLHLYEDENFMKEHPEVIIYTPEKIYRYEIFAAVVYDDRHLMNTFQYDLPEERQRFLDSIYNTKDLRNKYNQEIEVSVEDHILTLSTCMGNEPDNRFLVEAVLRDE